MRVQFLTDFRGKLTKENYYLAGEQGEFDVATAQALIAAGVAVDAPPSSPVEDAPASPAKPTKRGRK